MLASLISSAHINKNLPVPYYYQIAQILREAINTQELAQQEDFSFPSENELCELFQVNRGTIRHALQVLEFEGLIYREKGRGTFIRRRRLELDPTTLVSTSEDLRSRGWIPSVHLLSLTLCIPQPHIQKVLTLPPQEKVWEIYRLRLANEEPISLQWSYIPQQLVPDLDQKDLTGSLFNILRKDYGIHLQIADQMIHTRSATIEEASLLNTQPNSPLFEISRITYDAQANPIEYLDSLWRGDRYDMRVKLKIS